MKTAVILSGLALAASAAAQDSLISIPAGLCAGVLGSANCDQTESTAGGLINVPLNACVAALGTAKCNQASTASGNQGSLISVPLNVCLAVLGEAECNQKATAPGGLIDIPINLCLAVLGETQCNQNTGSSASATVPAISAISPSEIVIPSVAPTAAQPITVVPSAPAVLGASSVPAIAPAPVASWPAALGSAGSSVVVIGTTSTTTWCPESAIPTTLIPSPSGPAVAVAPTGAVPQPSTPATRPSSGVTPAYTGAAGHLEISGLTIALGALAIIGFQL